jgi:hypothetical protein
VLHLVEAHGAEKFFDFYQNFKEFDPAPVCKGGSQRTDRATGSDRLLGRYYVAEDAVAELVLLPVQARCRSCGEATEDEERIVACVACGSLEVETTGGDELTLESLEYRP